MTQIRAVAHELYRLSDQEGNRAELERKHERPFERIRALIRCAAFREAAKLVSDAADMAGEVDPK
jgi:hypothetical protein